MTRVAASGRVLRWALERSGKPDRIADKFPKLTAWMLGTERPTLRQLESLAKATATPLGYFFLSEPPSEQLPIPHFRTHGGQDAANPSADLLETVQIMERRQAWMREYLLEEGCEPLPFVASATPDDDPRRVAREMRRVLGLSDGWAAQSPTWTDALRELRLRMEAAGILVVVNSVVGNNTHRKLDVQEFRGFVLVDKYAPLVFVNGSDVKAAQMFTLAHELAHIWFGRSAAFDLRRLQPAANEVERACDRVAAEFLVPEGHLRDVWPTVQRDPDRFQRLARRFKVSELVIARRALDLGLLNRTEFFQFYEAYLDADRPERAQQDGGNFYATQYLRVGRRFAEAVIRAVREGRLLYREAYELTGLYGKAFEEFAKRLDMGELL